MNKYILSVLGAGICWGFMGFFTRNLGNYGIDTEGAIILRCGIAAVAFLIAILITDPSQLKIRFKDIWCFIGSGLLSLLFFTFCYFNAISMMNLSTAAILLYIAPAVVTLVSAVLFKEKITPVKAVAVVLSFAGCCLVSGVIGGLAITVKGLLFGIGSGVGYAFYTIFSRFALERGYKSNTINLYSCLLASVGASVIWSPVQCVTSMFSSVSALIWCVLAGIITCFVPYLLYTYSLTGLENGKASVIASVEPVVASLVGIFVFKEKIDLWSFLGIVLVLTAIIMLNIKKKEKVS